MKTASLLDGFATDEHYHYALAEVGRGAKPLKVTQRLIEHGLEPEVATGVVARVERVRAEVRSAAAYRSMGYGALWCVGGTLCTLLGYSNAESSGGGYYVFYGAIVIGAIQFLQGLVNYEVVGRNLKDAKPRSNNLERCVGRGALLGMAAGAAVGVAWGVHSGEAANWVVGLLLAPIPVGVVGAVLGGLWVLLRWFSGKR